ncbi:MAG: iron-sulfur cluster assembly scaffold protein [bacterium]
MKNNNKKINPAYSENVKGGVIGNNGQVWLYSEAVKKHFFNPIKFMKENEENKFFFNGMGKVGSRACGDEMIMWINVDPKTNIIKDCRWRTFGCGSAIAATSALAEMITENKGKTIDEAMRITPQDILKRLNGLPARKVHCSVLGDQALQSAISNYKKNHYESKS